MNQYFAHHPCKKSEQGTHGGPPVTLKFGLGGGNIVKDNIKNPPGTESHEHGEPFVMSLE